MARKLNVTIYKDYVFDKDLEVYRLKVSNDLKVDFTGNTDPKIIGEKIIAFINEVITRRFDEQK